MPKYKGQKERRKSVRTKTRAWVRAQLGEEQFPLRDLSPNGALIRMAHPPARGTELELTLHSIRLSEPIRVTAVVHQPRGKQGVGVEFTHFYGRGQLQLADLLANLVVPRILVVDEDENTRRRLTRLFNKENYSVLTTGDGPEALVLALESQLDLIIVDLDLSAPMTALEVLERLRPIPHVAQVPIVVLSGSRSAAAFTAARQLGAVGSVPKPFQTHKLLHFVRSLLEQ